MKITATTQVKYFSRHFVLIDGNEKAVKCREHLELSFLEVEYDESGNCLVLKHPKQENLVISLSENSYTENEVRSLRYVETLLQTAPLTITFTRFFLLQEFFDEPYQFVPICA